MTTTINGIPMRAARIRGELCNATDYTVAKMRAYLLRDGSMSWLDRAETVIVIVTLRRGYSSTDHLFDRLAQQVAEQIDGKLFADEAALHKAARNVSRPECGYTVEVHCSGCHSDVPPECESDAETIRAAVRKKDAAKAAKKRAKLVASLLVLRGDDGAYRVTTTEAHSRGHWVDAMDRRYWYCEGLHVSSGGSYVGLVGNNRGYGTEAEAMSALQAVRK